MESCIINFEGLGKGKHHFEFDLNQTFFDGFEFEQDFQNPKLKVLVEMNKQDAFIGFDYVIQGNVDLFCDLSNEPFEHQFKVEERLLVKFGEQRDLLDPEVWVVLPQDDEVDFSQLFYEGVLLNLPSKRYHPDVVSGKIDPALKAYLEPEKTNEIDPRWAALKELKEKLDNNGTS